ncbi:hypothetical protein TRIP_B350051 [uncultured Desulfatiglans sp.]|nr:hypothetical protein TRIP_B350051 [uncultured Desulfatiglans sp.]
MHRRYFVCFNPREAERQNLHWEAILKELRQKSDRHRSWNDTAKWATIELLATRAPDGISESARPGRSSSTHPSSKRPASLTAYESP